MFGTTFSHDLIRKYVATFGAVFSQVYVPRTDAANAEVQLVKASLSYSAKDKFLQRLVQDPGIDRPSAVDLPAMSFELVSLRYAQSRKLTTTTRIVAKSADPSQFYAVYQPVPYDLEFQLYVYVKNAEDGSRIVEQVLPFFTPNWTARVELIPELDEIRDVVIDLHSVTLDDSYAGSLTDHRVMVWSLDFTLRGYLYGPLMQKPVIKFVEADYVDGTANVVPAPLLATITYTPGLDANGAPTASPADSVDPLTISVDQDWGLASNSVLTWR